MAPAPSDHAHDLRARALAWGYRDPEQLAEFQDPWAHGTIYRDPRYPHLGDLNLIRVREAPAMTAAELHEFVERELRPYPQRRLGFDAAADAEPFHDYFRRRGYLTTRLTWMRFAGERPSPPFDPRVREVGYDAVDPLRRAWHREDFGDTDPTEYHEQAKAIRMMNGTRVLAILDGRDPVAYATVDLGEDGIEIGALYARPEHRGRGLGTALARSAIAGAETEHLWICADEDDRPKRLYARLGFRPVVTTGVFIRMGSITD